MWTLDDADQHLPLATSFPFISFILDLLTYKNTVNRLLRV